MVDPLFVKKQKTIFTSIPQNVQKISYHSAKNAKDSQYGDDSGEYYDDTVNGSCNGGKVRRAQEDQFNMNLQATQSLPENPHFGTLGGSFPSAEDHFSVMSHVKYLFCEKSIRRNA